ncbi:LysR substrate-binding domain-containing protein [Acidovorax soli]|uniref:LysR family transcriptional regulator, nitrogen assimilation regulatory protein n=1 Tax=Acidovorax soli TaxID=592050 RepID=A0A1H4FAU1_9BURK|nr:LysR substrate-binding domain-containing protein [Acidovorax soli]SEA94097.1 LysR family transcriptional regulator, nitrogen assimilation regulatory protein [Acidovorax soli]
MDLKQLEYFVRVAELQSFTRASIAIDVAQPALSRQVRQLEVELRHNLLVRNGRGVTLTEAGELFLEHARGILHQVEHAQESLGRLRGALAGRVAVGLPPSLAKRLTVPLSRAFRQRLPNATLSITESLSTAMQAALIAGRLDIALLYNLAPSNELDSEVILEEELFLISPADVDGRRDPVPLQALADVPLVIPTRPNAIRSIVEMELANISRRPLVAMEIDGVSAILDLVLDGVGHAVLPINAILTASQPQAFVARRIVGPEVRSRLALATSSQRPISPTQAAVAGLIRELVAHASAELSSQTTAFQYQPAE